jgi:hypothetical protein
MFLALHSPSLLSFGAWWCFDLFALPALIGCLVLLAWMVALAFLTLFACSFGCKLLLVCLCFGALLVALACRLPFGRFGISELIAHHPLVPSVQLFTEHPRAHGCHSV